MYFCIIHAKKKFPVHIALQFRHLAPKAGCDSRPGDANHPIWTGPEHRVQRSARVRWVAAWSDARWRVCLVRNVDRERPHEPRCSVSWCHGANVDTPQCTHTCTYARAGERHRADARQRTRQAAATSPGRRAVLDGNEQQQQRGAPSCVPRTSPMRSHVFTGHRPNNGRTG